MKTEQSFAPRNIHAIKEDPDMLDSELSVRFFQLYIIIKREWNFACYVCGLLALCGLQCCENRPALFPGQMSYKHLNQVLSVLYLSMFFLCCCLLGPSFCIVTFRCYVFCLLVVLVKLSVLAKWLDRKTPPRKPNRGEEIIFTKPRPKTFYDFLGLLYCFIVQLYVCVVPWPYVIYFILLWHDIACLCWKCR